MPEILIALLFEWSCRNNRKVDGRGKKAQIIDLLNEYLEDQDK